MLWPLALLSLTLSADLSPEGQLLVGSLRDGEQARVEKVLGSIDELPLYRAELELDVAKRRVTGKVWVSWPAKKETVEELFLRASPNAIEPDRIRLSNAVVNGAPVAIEHPDASLFKVKVDPPALPGVVATVEVRISATIPEAQAGSDSLMAGLGAANKGGDHGAFLAANEVISLAGLIPAVPAPGVDGSLSPGPSGIGDLASFSPSNWLVTMTVPSEWKVVSGGVELGEVPLKDGRRQFTWAQAASRDFALVVTHDYQVETQKVGDVTVESHFAEADAAAGKRSLKYAAEALKQFERAFGPYPFKTLRVVEARLLGGAGGMEFPGLITVSTGLYKGTADPFASMGMPGFSALMPELAPMLESTLEFTIAHEVAHQYFALLVGSDPVSEPCADEPLTQHAALLYFEWKHGKPQAEAMRKLQFKNTYQMHRMMGGADAVANRATNEFASTSEYAAVIYGKAPLMFDAHRRTMGDSLWFKTLRTYVSDNRYKSVRTDTVTKVAASFAPQNAKQLDLQRKHWLEETHGDEDIGVGDLSKLMGGMGAGGAGMKMDPATQKAFEAAIRALMGP